MTSQDLIQQLISDTENRIELAQKKLLPLGTEALYYKKNTEEWNALECLDHLHHYANYYHIKIANKLENSTLENELEFKASWLGKQFMKMFDEKKGKKYKTMPRMKPNNENLHKEAVARFIEEQVCLLNLLHKAKSCSLQKNKIPLEFFNLISLPLGDLFSFLNAHDKRHLTQAINISKQCP